MGIVPSWRHDHFINFTRKKDLLIENSGFPFLESVHLNTLIDIISNFFVCFSYKNLETKIISTSNKAHFKLDYISGVLIPELIFYLLIRI